MRKSAAALIMALLITAAAGTLLVSLGNANPNPFGPPAYAGKIFSVPNLEPPTISIISPDNNTICNKNSVYITYNVSVGKRDAKTTDPLFIHEISYRGDWQENATDIDLEALDYVLPRDFSINITDVPEGKHEITIYAGETGYYYPDLHVYYSFSINSSSTVSFTVDTVPPTVSVLSPRNASLKSPDAELHLAVNEPASRIEYCLDGQDNVTVAGNSTLSGLPVGLHNVTVYAWDAAGNVGASETVTFTVTEPESFPTVPAVAVSAVSIIAVTAAGLLLYNRKRRKEAQQT